jgi:hypothetical protein
MAMIIEEIRAKFAMTGAQWVLFAWMMSGLVSIVIGLGISFVPSAFAEVALVAVSAAIGVAIVFWSLHHPGTGKKIRALGPLRRVAQVAFSPVMFAFLSAGNIYMALFIAHSTTAYPAERSVTVSFKSTGIDLPWKCKHYIRFSDLPFLYVMKACVSVEVFESVRPGSKLTMLGTQSSFGFRGRSKQ